MFLLIDDSIIDRIIVKKVLEANFENQSVEEVSGAEEAINWLKDQRIKIKEKINILLDIRMPELSGFDFLDIFVGLPAELRNDINIFMLSSTLDPQDIKKAKEHSSVVKLLEKPLDPQVLRPLIS